jgi:hypothetical protein
MATVFVTKNNNLEEFIEIELVKKYYQIYIFVNEKMVMIIIINYLKDILITAI